MNATGPSSPTARPSQPTRLLRRKGRSRLQRTERLRNRLARAQAEAGAIEAEIARLERILPAIRERAAGRLRLVEEGHYARLKFLELEQELLEQEGQLGVQRRRLAEAGAAVAVVLSQRRQAEAEFRRGVLADLTEARRRASSLEQELIKARERSRLQTLTAPVAGVVQQLAVHTVGGVVTPAQQLMVIVPEDSALEIEAMVLNKDAGFVHEGQEAEVKVESFPFTRYGTVAGTVRVVSRDAVADDSQGLVYPARVAMARTTIRSGEADVALGPGMAVTVEIRTGERRLIEYLLAPLQRYRDESLRER